jgi:hypothetical protein
MSERAPAGEWMLKPLLALQVTCALVAVLVPFGFDKPSTLGLDFGHLLALAALYLVAFLSGLVLAARLRRWKVLVGELALPAALIGLVLTGVLGV